MRIELTSGVHLNLIQTNQFKTTRISVQFVAPLAQATVTKRTLLTSLLETNSQDYPTQAQLSAHLENMFGASFGIGVAREGRLHRVSATLNLIADRFSDTTLMADGFGFLARILLRPNIREGAFDQATFERERENLADYLASLDDDRQTQAALGLQQLYFASDPDQATPSFGRREDLLTLDAQQMATYYEQMIQEDQIEITVLGQFEEADVIRLAKQFAFTPRAELNQLATYDHEIGEQRSETVQANVNQAKLNFGYHVAIDDFGPAYYAAIVTESLFGGSPLSLLFTNVREKESLAYYASSQLDALRHFMLVQTGIDADSVARVTELVEAQRQKLIDGDFTDEQIQIIKDGLLNHRLAAYDNPRFLSNQALYQALVPNAPMDLETFTAGVNQVTKSMIQASAAQMTLEATYLLTGGQDNGED